MIYPEKNIIQNDFTLTLRSARKEDAADLLAYLKQTAGETPYLIREPEEITISLEQEAAFLEQKEQNPGSLMLLAFVNGHHAGNCSVRPIGDGLRYRHRCSISIALYLKYCGKGMGETMLREVLAAAKEMGYEQAELEVVASNRRAKGLYEKLGFVTYGRFPDNMKYKDGTYEDCEWMMRKL